MRRPLSILAALSAVVLGSACEDPAAAIDTSRTFVQTTPTVVDIVQGQTFTIEAWDEFQGLRKPADVDVASLPSGLVLVEKTNDGASQRTKLTLRGTEALEAALTLTRGGVPLFGAAPIPVKVREAGAKILAHPNVFEDQGEKRMVLLPQERGQTQRVGAVATDEAGCAVAGGANVIQARLTGDVGAFTISSPFVGGPVFEPGCPDATDAAVEVDFTWETATPRLGLSYDIGAASREGDALLVGALPGRYAPETATGGLPATGTITRTETTCGAFEPGTFDFSAVILFDEGSGLRILNPDGSSFQGSEAPLGEWAFTSPLRPLGTGFSLRETINAGRIDYRREVDGGVVLQWDGTTRIDYTITATGEFVCNETATHTASARIPRFGFRFLF
jgi:hypothetical protein